MLERILGIENRLIFRRICRSAQLKLSYNLNSSSLSTLKDVFEHREYSDYFPFYEKVTVVDVGAHYGFFSIFASRNTNPKSVVYAIEPSHRNFQVLKQNLLSTSVSNVIPVKAAIGKDKRNGVLYEGVSVNNSLISNYPLLGERRAESKVQITDLSSMMNEYQIEEIDFLKMDCEGSEYEIIYHTPRAVFERIKVLSLEFHDLKDEAFTGKRLILKLQEYGFDIVRFKYNETVMDLNYGKIVGIR